MSASVGTNNNNITDRTKCQDCLILLASLLDATSVSFVPDNTTKKSENSIDAAVSAKHLLDLFDETKGGASFDPFRLVAALREQRVTIQEEAQKT